MSLESLRILKRLSIARRADLNEEHLQVFAEELADIPIELLGLAAQQLAREPRPQFGSAFPTLGDIRARVEVVKVEQAEAFQANLRALAPPTSREPTYFCLTCFDEPSGFRVFGCRGMGAFAVDVYEQVGVTETRYCGRAKDHLPHTYVERCGCWQTNPVIAQHRHRMQESARRRGATED